MEQKIKDICAIATAYDWEYFSFDPNNKMLSLVKDGDRINVYLSKMTVGIVIDGKQTFEKLVTMEKLERIFIKTIIL